MKNITHSKWSKIKVGELGRIVTGKTPPTKNKSYWNGVIPFITPADLQAGKNIIKTERNVSEEGLNAVKGCLLPARSICVSCIGNLGYTAMTTQTSISNQQINSIIPYDDFDNDFVYYLMKSLWSEFKNLEGQSTTLSILNKSLFTQMIVAVPQKDIQKRIARILRAFDDKIELNRQINHNLEEQAKAIFKSWFIESPQTSTWEQATLSEIVESMIGGDWGKDAPTGKNVEKTYCIRGADIPDINKGSNGKMPTRYILPLNYQKKRLVDGDLVVEISGGSPTQSTGRCATISDALLTRYEKKIICTNFCKALKPKQGYRNFLYYFWSYLYDKGTFFSYENGTTGIKNLNISGVLENEVFLIPPSSLLYKFNSACDSMFSVIFANGMENVRLTQLRDALLPKLMSGEIDVSEVEV